ncbi:Uncharacterised protein [Legionella wadsworthii]|uniref:Uncharacterized protein n=1 Tax=Legionella wadsworthii TaxID=28088 RepID=A0A378LYK8_9GAMM|nr:hypothetical protein [Legionella wadsworthii]STY29151.1 Uncharacterised protein [Legionella wadsworthii]
MVNTFHQKDVELLVIREVKENGIAVCLKPQISYVITPTLVNEIRIQQNKIAEEYYSNPWEGILYVFWYLHSGQITWRGLDYKYIYDAIKQHKEKLVEDYIENIADLLFLNNINLALPLINCSIVHRKVTGLSQDFFLINQVNFIKNTENGKIKKEDKSIHQINLFSDVKNLNFPKRIYKNNVCYRYSRMDFPAMRKIIKEVEHCPIHSNQLVRTQFIFELMKKKIVNSIFDAASKNIKLFERFAAIQSIEHKNNRR